MTTSSSAVKATPIQAKSETYTHELNYPLYTIDTVNNKRAVPLALELDNRSGKLKGLLFTSPEAAQSYANRKQIPFSLRSFATPAIMYQAGMQTLQSFPDDLEILLDPTGGVGLVLSLSLKDLLYAIRDYTNKK
jgi:hypothetical protein